MDHIGLGTRIEGEYARTRSLAAGRMTEETHAAAAAALADVTGGSATMTVAQCREVMTKLGHECTETDPKVCTEKLKALGITMAQVAADAGVGTLVLTHLAPVVNDPDQIDSVFRDPAAEIFDGELIVALDGTEIILNVE